MKWEFKKSKNKYKIKRKSNFLKVFMMIQKLITLNGLNLIKALRKENLYMDKMDK
jgi:hypothetical protein